MRRFALIFATVIGLAVGALNYIDTKYPGGIRNLNLSGTAAGSQPTATPQAPAAASAQTAEAQKPADFTAPEVQPMWPGSKIARIAYGARRYEDMTVVSINAQSVLLRNDREIVSIPTASLPAELREMALAYLSGSDGPPFARVGSPAFPPPPAAAKPVPSAAPVAVPAPSVAPPEAQPQPALPDVAPDGHGAIASQAARQRAEWWLRYERERRIADIVPLVTGVDLQPPYPLTGLPGYWRVRGRGYVATYQEDKGGTFHDFEITVVLDAAGNVLRADIKLL